MSNVRLINQNDYEDTVYITKTSKSEQEREDGLHTTVKSSGCGLCCAMMVAQHFDCSLSMDEAIQLSYSSKANISYGTLYKQYSNALCDRLDLTCERTSSKEKLFECLDDGGCAVVNVGGDHDDYLGLFSNIGHFVFINQRIGNDLYILDPGYYDGKYDKTYRKDKIRKQDDYIVSDIKYLFEDITNRQSPVFLYQKTERINDCETLKTHIKTLTGIAIKEMDGMSLKEIETYLIDRSAKQLWDIDDSGDYLCISMNCKPACNTINADSLYKTVCAMSLMKVLKDSGFKTKTIKLVIDKNGLSNNAGEDNGFLNILIEEIGR